MSSTTQRRIKPIQDHVDSGNWKQALQLCEKYQKKGEKSEAFLTIRALVLANQPDEKQRKQGRDSLLQLCKQDPPVTDEDTIILLDNALTNLGLDEGNSLRLWERAASARPGDIDLLEKWISRAVTEQNWISAQKAAMMLRKNFPKDRHYEFWNIFMCDRIHKDSRSDERTRTLFSMMAYKMIAKLAADTPVVSDEKADISPGKAIHTIEELYLLVKVYTDGNHLKEALEILQSENLGAKSRVAKQDPLLFRDLFVSVLEKLDNHEEVAKMSRILMGFEENASGNDVTLSKTPYIESLELWSILVSATMKCEQPELTAKLQSNIEQFRKENPQSRHAAMAYLTLLVKQSQSGHDVSEKLFEACKEIYENTYDKPTCVADLANGLDQLSQESLNKFIEHAGQYVESKLGSDDSASPKSFALANLSQLQFAFKASLSGQTDQLYDIVQRSLSLSATWAKGESEPSPSEVLILFTAISSFVNLSGLKGYKNEPTSSETAPELSLLVYALLIVQFLQTRASSNHIILLLFTRLSQVLGLSSMAFNGAHKLSIKNLQWDTFGHTVLTRLSTIHPHNAYGARSSDGTHISPLLAIRDANQLYKRAEDSMTSAVMQGLDHKSYKNTNQTIEFSNNLKNSICRKIYYVESERIRRLTGSVDHRWQNYPISSVDNRNFGFFPNNDSPKQPTTEERLRFGPLPKDLWLRAMLASTRCYQALVEGPATGSFANETSMSDFLLTLKDAEDVLKAKSLEFTTVESSAVELQLNVGLVALALSASLKGQNIKSSGSDAELVPMELLERSLDAVINSLEKLVTAEPNRRLSGIIAFSSEQSKEPVRAPHWEYFHGAYSILDSLKFVSQLLTFADVVQKTPSPKSKASVSKKLSLDSNKRSQLKNLSLKIQDLVHEHAKELKIRLTRQGALDEIVNSIMSSSNNGLGQISEQLEEMIGMATIETVMGEMRDSWEEGLERLVSTRVIKN